MYTSARLSNFLSACINPRKKIVHLPHLTNAVDSLKLAVKEMQIDERRDRRDR